MRVGVGSGNPVKRRAVESVVEADVEAIPVVSGVPEQPRGHAATAAGAENRARNVLARGGFDYGVGVEGGVASFAAGEGGDGWDGAEARPLYLVMWAAVADGERLARAAGPSLRLPDAVADRVLDGEELGPVVDDVLGTEGVPERQGAAGVLTDGRLDREAALASAVAGAFGPFRVDLYEA
ncbi:MAG: DUF84 family protein [Haloferacaceae archaeon]